MRNSRPGERGAMNGICDEPLERGPIADKKKESLAQRGGGIVREKRVNLVENYLLRRS